MSTLQPGFHDPVRDSQSVFRAVMDAMARPGRIHRVSGPSTPPAPLDRATAAILLTLVDGETKLWLDQPASAASEWVAFHCGAPLASVAAAQFGVALGAAPLDAFGTGTDEEPESSATVILQVSGLGTGPALRLSGPGLAGEEMVRVDGLPDGFEAFWLENGRLFPRGVDVILCAGDTLAALPRTVRIA